MASNSIQMVALGKSERRWAARSLLTVSLEDSSMLVKEGLLEWWRVRWAVHGKTSRSKICAISEYEGDSGSSSFTAQFRPRLGQAGVIGRYLDVLV